MKKHQFPNEVHFTEADPSATVTARKTKIPRTLTTAWSIKNDNSTKPTPSKKNGPNTPLVKKLKACTSCRKAKVSVIRCFLFA